MKNKYIQLNLFDLITKSPKKGMYKGISNSTIKSLVLNGTMLNDLDKWTRWNYITRNLYFPQRHIYLENYKPKNEVLRAYKTKTKKTNMEQIR